MYWWAYGCAALDVESSDWVTVVHCVECCDFVDTHWWHLEQSRDLVHDADAGETVLSLAEIEEWHDGGLFVLRWVSGEDLLDELLILGVEFERDVEVVFWVVTVLRTSLASCEISLVGVCHEHTTKRESPLLTGAETVKARVCARNAGRSALEALLKTIGASLEAMVSVVVGGYRDRFGA